MITAEQLRGTAEGEVFEVAGIFRSLDPAAVITLVTVQSIAHASGPRVILDAKWLGISLGEWTAEVFGEDVKWSF